jgi:hypothetical protein
MGPTAFFMGPTAFFTVPARPAPLRDAFELDAEVRADDRGLDCRRFEDPRPRD